MTHWRLILFTWALFALDVAHARQPGNAVVTARLAKDGVHASVALDRPVTRFAFAEADVIREGDFELLTPGLTFEDDAVTAPMPFRRFELLIRPMTQERDAKYPAHFRIGSGGVLYAPALKADPSAWHTRLSFKTGPGQMRAPSTGEVGDGFVFIGPAALVLEDEDILLVADPRTPPWLVERSRAALIAAVNGFTDVLDASLPRKPLLIVKHQDGERNFNVGDVTPGAITSLRFHGPAWTEPDEAAGKNIQNFVLHEAFHFWNGGLASHAESAPAWLHEGGAEYAALLAGLQTGVLSGDDVRQRLSGALQRCRFALQNLGDKGMAEIAFLPVQVRYPCGMVLQWAADLHVRGTSGGARTLMDTWGDVIRVARRRPSNSYDLADFYAAAGIEEGEMFRPSALLVSESGPERWTALPAALKALGAEVTQRPTAEGRRGALLFHLLNQNCRSLPKGTSIGFYTNQETIKLDSPAGCGGLAGDPVLKSVEGGDPFTVTPETYATVQRKCAAKATVTLTAADGRSLTAKCTAPLSAAPEDYIVERWMPLPPAL